MSFVSVNLSEKGDLAIGQYDSLYYVFDSNYKQVVKGNIGKKISENAVITKTIFVAKDSVLLFSVALNYLVPSVSNGVILVETPIYKAVNNADCFGAVPPDLGLFDIELKSYDIDFEQIADVMTCSNSTVTITDFLPQQIALCKQVSICNSVSVTGTTEVCVGSQVTYTANKALTCLKNIKWFINELPVTIIDRSDNFISLIFNENWQGYIVVELENCGLKDSIWVQAIKPIKDFTIGSDMVICPDSNVVLKHSSQVGSIIWQDGSVTDSLIVDKPGRYWAKVTDYCGNIFTDTIVVANATMLPVTNLPPMVDLCKGLSYTLNASTGFTNYFWQPNQSISTTNSKTVIVNPETNIKYYLSAVTGEGCMFIDSTFIKVSTCPISYFVPNVFTPNSDGVNDLFKPYITGPVESYEFIIYNRWGNVVFKTNNTTLSWDGKVGGKTQPTGNYIWTCRLKYVQQEVITKKGSLMLIR